jgi:hypothetical protein
MSDHKARRASTLRTYSHLAQNRKVPDDYDLTTTRLHYYVGRGFEVNTPIAAWYAANQSASRLRAADWDRFADPARTTYSRYTAIARQREAHVDGILRSIDELRYDSGLKSDWLDLLDRIIGPVRYPMHALQMVASYAGSMAPAGRVTILLAFQAGHEMRRIQRLTYRMVQLRSTRSDFGTRAKAIWQEGPEWQPLRKLIERLLVTYDWGESLIALNLCVKPAFDGLFSNRLAAEAMERGDPLFAEILVSFAEDSAWQRDWTRALVDGCMQANPDTRDAIESWTSSWRRDIEAALEPFAFGKITLGKYDERVTVANA